MSSFKLVTFASNSTIDDSRYLKKCIYQFHRAHKFYGNASVEIRVFQGAKEMGNQWIPFHQTSEILDLNAGVKIIYLSSYEVNKNHMTEEDIINWLSLGDIHIILTHIHQGICRINMAKLYSMLYRELNIHPGFPIEESLRYPVFTQDKYAYLDALMPKGLCNPTLKVVFEKDMNYSVVKVLIKE